MSPTFSGNYPTRSSQHATMALRPFDPSLNNPWRLPYHTSLHYKTIKRPLFDREIGVQPQCHYKPFGCTSVDRSIDRSTDTNDPQGARTSLQLHSEAHTTTKEDRKSLVYIDDTGWSRKLSPSYTSTVRAHLQQ